MNKKPVITIDGPAGAGKTTVSQRIANIYQYIWVDTGALYRGVALAAMQKGIAVNDNAELDHLCHSLNLHFVREDNQLKLYNFDQNISNAIRTPEVTMMASKISAKPLVRQYLLDVQRKLGCQGGAVFEGRDMGTVVFPDADIKFFLVADHEIRAQRRYKECLEKSIKTSLAELSNDMKQRDEQDQQRKIAPLKPAKDAIHIDCTSMDIDQVVQRMCLEINTKIGNE
ncbi:MAG: cytidylate kinase [Candidatus Magnetoglobus multicellularis str. Araruama]|uniref:Cytidylate kinase n=1 Tax=Candidatus Magnetoglobus multicellularis str. Araruama TaxID=890399 RepID=A0A1V1PCC2_9BACT|nr:MAG: cytidylate kinase [Candidatus Magnetoglobus multicellularis str. Araruama]